MKRLSSKNFVRILSLILLISITASMFCGLNMVSKADEIGEPIVVEDFENRIVVNSFKPSSEYTSYYTGESRLTGSEYWQRSSWAVITNDKNPSADDATLDRSGNEYMKFTYIYEGADTFGKERKTRSSIPTNYYKSEYPSYYTDYAFNPGIIIPNDTKAPTAGFTGEEGKYYKITVDIALVEDDGKDIKFYALPVTPPTGAITSLSGTNLSGRQDAIYICGSNDTGDKKLALQSKSNYTFKTYEFIYKAEDGKNLFLAMETNNHESIGAPATKTDFACAYVDNVKIYEYGKYLISEKADANKLFVKYEDGDKLADITPEVSGYNDDGKWYDDYDCKTLSTDIYPQNGKTYYRKWTKFITLDFENDYMNTTGSRFYKNPLDPSTGDYAGTYTRSDVIGRMNDSNGNGVMMMTYCNDNPVYRASGRNYGSGGEHFHNYKCSPYIYLYDAGTSDKFSGSPDFKYKISFDYEILGPIPKEDVSFCLYLTANTVSASNAAINALTEANGSILVGKFDVNVAEGSKGRTKPLEFTAKMNYSPRIVMVTNNGVRAEVQPQEYHTAYIDNIEIQEEFPTTGTPVSISFDSNGGTSVTGFRVLKGNPLGQLPTPTRTDYLFDCWYRADDPTEAEVYQSVVALDSMKLKAKWVQVTASDYANSEQDKFTTMRYQNVLEDYSDLDFDTLVDTGIASSVNTVANRYIKSGCPNNMGAALLLSNKPFAMSNAASGIACTALLNADGSKFAVKKGTRYKVEFDYLPLGGSSAHTYIRMIYGSYTADTVNASNVKGITNVAAHGLQSDTQHITQYFSASQDGFVFFTLGSRQNFDSTAKDHFVLLDNVRITVESKAKKIEFVDASGASLSVNPFGYDIQYGMPGEKIRDFGFTRKVGKYVEGFYNDKECTSKCTNYDTFTNADRTVYVKFASVDYSVTSDLSSPITLDFENDKNFDLDVLYTNRMYMTHTSTDPQTECDYVPDDEENANSGTGYMRVRDIKYVYGSDGQSFVLYDKNNPSGIMILEPNESYRITAMVKYEDDAKAPLLRFWFVDPTTWKTTRNNDANLTMKSGEAEGYVEISSVFTVKDSPKAIQIGAVYLAEQDVYIDDVKVEKMQNYTINFVTNGGDPVDDIITLPYTSLSQVDPGAGFRPGYDFIGWFLDEAFTKPFDFLNDYITGNTTLYAKFELEAEDEEENQEADNTETEEKVFDDEEDLNNFEDEDITETERHSKFGIKLNLADSEKLKSTKTTVKVDNSIPIYLIIIASVAALLLTAGGILTFLLVRRKKRG